jgi:hypothetical protein
MSTEPITEPAAAEEPRPEPCRACPWRIDNHSKPHPDGWYTKANRDRLWSKLRRGEGMSCHPTDPRNPVSDRAQEVGYRPAPEHAEVRECVGALVLQQREGQIINDMLTAGGTFTGYRKRRPRGLTREGIAVVIERLIFGGTLGTRAMPKPDLNAPVGHDPLPWPPPK